MAKGRWQQPELSYQSGAANYMPLTSVGELTPATLRLECATEKAEREEAECRARMHSSNDERIEAQARQKLGGES